jgi:hypothetical protein
VVLLKETNNNKWYSLGHRYAKISSVNYWWIEWLH